MVRLFDSYFCSAPSLTLSREQLLSICHLPFLSEEEAEESFSESHLLVGDKWIRGLILSPGPERWIIYFFFSDANTKRTKGSDFLTFVYLKSMSSWSPYQLILSIIFSVGCNREIAYYFLCWLRPTWEQFRRMKQFKINSFCLPVWRPSPWVSHHLNTQHKLIQLFPEERPLTSIKPLLILPGVA